MNTNEKVLKKLEEKNLHVHVIEDDEKLPIPYAIKSISTHYVMDGSKIVFCGSSEGVVNWVMSQ